MTIEVVLHYDPTGTECQLTHRKKTATFMVNGNASQTVLVKVSLILSPQEKHTIETATNPVTYFQRTVLLSDPSGELTVIISLTREKEL